MRIHSTAHFLFISLVVALVLVNVARSQQQLPKEQQYPLPQEKKCQVLGCTILDTGFPPAPQDQSAKHDAELKGVTFRKVFSNLPDDQRAIWTSPFHIRGSD